MSLTPTPPVSGFRRRLIMANNARKGGYPADAIMTADTNPDVLAVCYAQGWCAHEDYMTRSEAEAVTGADLGDGTKEGAVFAGHNEITHFDEFRYFTGVTYLPQRAFYQCHYMQYMTLPPTLVDIGEFSLRFESSGRNYFRRVIILGTALQNIGAYALYNWGFSNQQFLVIKDLATPPTLGTAATTGNYSIEKVYVPDAAVDDYKAATRWSEWGDNILPLSDCPPAYLEYQGINI